jgi:Asp-tRNA(Asn)/Glu-tRNA(Gln) amidotransferase A subunit family amidase
VAKPAITASTIAAAETIAGVVYTAAERKQMLGNIAAQIELAVRRRAHKLPLALAPATRFDPRLPDWTPRKPERFRPAKTVVPPLPERAEDIAFAPLTALAGWIKARQLTSVGLTEIYLERIARIGPRLQCFATVTGERALAEARRADAAIGRGQYRGPLHGIPWGAKDILDTAGIRTGWGAEPYRRRVPDTDAAVVQKLRQAGAVLLGKTSVGALAYGDIWYGGVTRNPWNTAEGSSGSSAGSCSATAAGLVGFALGTETLGSIVVPSMRCGTTGLRPTFGRVSRAGAMPLCWTLDKIGPICRSVEDTALVLAAIDGFDTADPNSIPAPFGYDSQKPVAGMKVGYYPADFALPEIDKLDRAALAAARRAGLELVPLKRPELPYASLMSVLFAEAAASFEALTLEDRDDELTWQEPGAWPNTFRKARFLSAIDHIQLDRLRRQTMQVMNAAFDRVDAIVGPSLVGPMLVISNFTGHPCLVLPAAFRQSATREAASLARGRLDQGATKRGAKHLVPHGICIWGRLFDEGTVIRVGRALEAVFAVSKRRPPVG